MILLQPLQVTSPSCGVYSTLALKGLNGLFFYLLRELDYFIEQTQVIKFWLL